MKKSLIFLAILVFAACTFGQKYHPDVQAVQDVIEKWDAGYRAMDPKAMSATMADQYDFVNRFGQWLNYTTREDYEKAWSWTFADRGRSPRVAGHAGLAGRPNGPLGPDETEGA